MLTPEFLQAMPKRFVNLWTEVESDITAQIAKRMVKTNFTVGASSSWQIQKLLEMSKMDEDVVKELAKATKRSEAEVRRAITESGFTGLNYDEQIYKRAGMDVNGVQYALTHSIALRDVLNAGIAQTNELVKNFTGTTAETAQHAYYNAMDKAWIGLMSGAYSPQQVIAQSVKEIAEKGFEKIAYPSGHRDSLEVAARRAILTGANQTTARLQLTRADELGCDLVEVTSHAGARPTHAVWQGKVYSRSGKTKGYKDFVSSTGYGTGDGLCGWNCRHNFYPYFEGLSSPSFSHDPAREYLDKSNAEMYEDSQKQRALERAIRQTKRACMALDAARKAAESEELQKAMTDAYNAASVQLRNRRKALEDFAELKDRTLEDERISVNGFGHSEASKASWAARKKLAQGGSSPAAPPTLTEINTETAGIAGQNVLTGSAESGTIAQGEVVSRLPDRPDQMKHIFRSDEGHVPQTPGNEAKLVSVANDPTTTLGKDMYGNTWHAEYTENGEQWWVTSRDNGIIQDGGKNLTPKKYDADTGLNYNPGKDPHNPLKKGGKKKK